MPRKITPVDRAAAIARAARFLPDPTPMPPRRYHGYEAAFAEWATSNGWDVTKRGWPDFLCRRDGALMAVEVKGGKDDLTPDQIDTLNDLSAVGLPTYVYHYGLGLKRWRGRKPESVANLKAEISDLHELIRKVVQIRDGMVPGIDRPPVREEWTVQDELDAVIRWCRDKHSEGHNQYGTRMTHCAWIYFLHKHEGRTFKEIVGILETGFPAQLQGLYRKAESAVRHARGLLAA